MRYLLVIVKHEGNAAKNLGGGDIASEGHALACNRFLYHVVAVTGLCFLSFTLRLLVASQLAMVIREGFQEPHVASTVCRVIAGRCPVIVPSLIISICSATEACARQ